MLRAREMSAAMLAQTSSSAPGSTELRARRVQAAYLILGSTITAGLETGKRVWNLEEADGFSRGNRWNQRASLSPEQGM